MPMGRCVVYGCSNGPSSGVTLHGWPVNNKMLCTKWFEFVCETRSAKDKHTLGYYNNTVICSDHFPASCYVGQDKKQRLQTGSVPTIYPQKIRLQADPSSSVAQLGILKKRILPQVSKQMQLTGAKVIVPGGKLVPTSMGKSILRQVKPAPGTNGKLSAPSTGDPQFLTASQKQDKAISDFQRLKSYKFWKELKTGNMTNFLPEVKPNGAEDPDKKRDSSIGQIIIIEPESPKESGTDTQYDNPNCGLTKDIKSENCFSSESEGSSSTITPDGQSTDITIKKEEPETYSSSQPMASSHIITTNGQLETYSSSTKDHSYFNSGESQTCYSSEDEGSTYMDTSNGGTETSSSSQLDRSSGVISPKKELETTSQTQLPLWEVAEDVDPSLAATSSTPRSLEFYTASQKQRKAMSDFQHSRRVKMRRALERKSKPNSVCEAQAIENELPSSLPRPLHFYSASQAQTLAMTDFLNLRTDQIKKESEERNMANSEEPPEQKPYTRSQGGAKSSKHVLPTSNLQCRPKKLRNHTCSKCIYGYANIGTLENHLATHPELKTCTRCKTIFYQTESYQSHMKSHKQC